MFDRKFSLALVAGMFLIALPATLPAKVPADMPEHIDGIVTLNAEGFIDLANKKPDLVVIDARITRDRAHGFIEGSVSLPDIATSCESLQKVLTNKDLPALFYCNGVKCGRSVKSIRIAQVCGYSNMYWFRGGFEEWRASNYPYIKE